MNPETITALLGILLVLGGGGLAVLTGAIRRPRARPSAPDPRLQTQADRAEAAEVADIQAREDAIRAEGAAVLAEPDEIERARRVARMRG